MFYLFFVFDVCYKLFTSGSKTDNGGQPVGASGGNRVFTLPFGGYGGIM
jgi:hypothetical protein